VGILYEISADVFVWAHWAHFCPLPMALYGPRLFRELPSETFKWDHRWQMQYLLMSLCGPIEPTLATPDSLASAQTVRKLSSESFRCHTDHVQFLPMSLYGPVNHFCLLPMALHGPRLLGQPSSESLRWTHTDHVQFLPMISYGNTRLATPNGLAWAQTV